MKRLGVLILLCLSFAGLVWAEVKCFKCHPKEAFQGKVKHGPVKEERCRACHTPHVSKYPALLVEERPALCFSCHEKFKKALDGASWVHLPVEKGACNRCHKPHAGSQGLLVEKGSRLCFNCHTDLKKKKFRFTHAPFKEGRCASCHEAHFAENQELLSSRGNSLCFRCHNRKQTLTLHGSYASERMGCLECHNPHGSGRKALVRDQLHAPYARKACNECHRSAQKGPEMCLRCHPAVEPEFLKVHTHYLPSQEKPFCLDCHAPHASDNRLLLAGSPERVCIRCHREALVQERESLHVHPLRVKGNCLDCHEGHASKFAGMLKGDGNSVCVNCHKTQGKFTHPVGKEVKDPRNGQSITCVTCHDPMGTSFKYELRLSGEAALCLECHKGY